MAKSGFSLLIISISNHVTIRSESPRARTASSPSGSKIAGIVDPLRFAPRIPSLRPGAGNSKSIYLDGGHSLPTYLPIKLPTTCRLKSLIFNSCGSSCIAPLMEIGTLPFELSFLPFHFTTTKQAREQATADAKALACGVACSLRP